MKMTTKTAIITGPNKMKMTTKTIKGTKIKEQRNKVPLCKHTHETVFKVKETLTKVL